VHQSILPETALQSLAGVASEEDWAAVLRGSCILPYNAYKGQHPAGDRVAKLLVTRPLLLRQRIASVTCATSCWCAA